MDKYLNSDEERLFDLLESKDADQLEAVVIVLEETKVQELMTSGHISCTSKASLHSW